MSYARDCNPRYSVGGSRLLGTTPAEPRQTLSPPPSSPSAEQTRRSLSPEDRRVSVRSLFKEQARRFHPDLVLQDDVEILLLGDTSLDGYSTDQKIAWLQEEWESTVAEYGSEEAARKSITSIMEEMVEPTGEKPALGDPDVQYIHIPKKNLSLRFWPGSLADAEYCMDFVVTQTKAPINVPENYTVWVVPDPAMPWLEPTATEVRSIERIHGIQPHDIEEGAEKFILRDGLHCSLVDNGEPVLRFRVPARSGALLEDGIPTAVPKY